MADEPEVTPAPEPTPPVEPSPAPEPDKPHPLEPGGERFNEVYRRMKDSEGREADLRERLARVEGHVQATQAKPTAPTVYTHEQLQALKDQGRITDAQMADQLAWQRTQALEQSLEAKLDLRDRMRAAVTEVGSYLAKVRDLRDQTSEKFLEVAQSAREIAADLGKPVSDPIVQRLALRATLGPLDRIVSTTQTREFDRQHADTFTEQGGGGGQRQPASQDPLKDVDPAYLEQWKRLNYTRQQMLDEAKFIRIKKPRVMSR